MWTDRQVLVPGEDAGDVGADSAVLRDVGRVLLGEEAGRVLIPAHRHVHRGRHLYLGVTRVVHYHQQLKGVGK